MAVRSSKTVNTIIFFLEKLSEVPFLVFEFCLKWCSLGTGKPVPRLMPFMLFFCMSFYLLIKEFINNHRKTIVK
jgi:hypothetical protein